MLLAVVVLLASILFVVTNGYNTTKSLVLVALVLTKVIESIADAAYGVMQVKDRLYISGISLTMKSVLGIAAFIAIDFLSGSLFASCLSLVAVNVAILLGFDLPFAARLEELRIKTKHRRIQLKRALQIIKASTPVFAATFLSMFSLNIPRYFLDRYYTEDVALYGIFAMPITVIVLLVSFILQPNIVGLSKLYAQKKYELYDKSIRKIVVLSLAIGAGAVFATVLFGEWAVRIIFNVPIENQTISLNVMVVGAVFNAIVAIFTVIFTIMRRFKHQVYILLISNLLLALIGVIIGQRINLSVAAILFSITNIVQAVVMALTYQLTKRRHV
jgi:O-antigen/teichoic acid export membrane protein